MNTSRWLVLVGAVLLIGGAFLPWISVPVLYGVSGPAYEGIEVGWEGDGTLTGGVGAVLLLGELLLGRAPRRWHRAAGGVLAALAAAIVLLDFGQIVKMGPKAGFFAATDIGLYVTLAGALLALIGCLWRPTCAPVPQDAAPEPVAGAGQEG